MEPHDHLIRWRPEARLIYMFLMCLVPLLVLLYLTKFLVILVPVAVLIMIGRSMYLKKKRANSF